MAIFLLDSNAIVKYYVAESGTTWVRQIVNSAVNTSVICEISIAEVAAALAQIRRSKRFGRTFMQDAYARFRTDMQQLRFISHPTDLPTIDLAAQLAFRRQLKGYDAIQVATSLQVKIMFKTNVTFISGDEQALQAAKLEGLYIDNPFEHVVPQDMEYKRT